MYRRFNFLENGDTSSQLGVLGFSESTLAEGCNKIICKYKYKSIVLSQTNFVRTSKFHTIRYELLFVDFTLNIEIFLFKIENKMVKQNFPITIGKDKVCISKGF